MGLLAPKSGEILIDGTVVNDKNCYQLRENIPKQYNNVVYINFVTYLYIVL